MDYYYRVIKNVKYFYNAINPASLSGAIDVVVVEQPDGQFLSTPFHVRFGKYGVFSHSEKYVDITINGEEIDLKMKLGASGVAFFVEETDDKIPDYLATSPLPEDVEFRQQPDVRQVLDESARLLTEKQRTGKLNTKVRLLSESSEISESRSPSPPPTLRTAEEQLAEQQAKAAEKVKGRRLALPRLSSVFSQRRNRSLPDLTTLNDQPYAYHSDVEEGQKSSRSLKKKFRHSKSITLCRRKLTKDMSDVDVLEISDDSAVKEKGLAPARRKKSRVQFAPTQPINIITRELESDGESTGTSSSISSPAGSLVDSNDVDALADGALSDSEVDRHRREPSPANGNEVTDWKWGEIPQTDKEKEQSNDAEKPKGKKSYYGISSWLWWGSGNSAPSTSKEPKEEEAGIYLDDLVGEGQKDPEQIERYLGKGPQQQPSVPYADSGKGSSRGPTQPSSPTAVRSDASSDTEMYDKTPTQEGPDTASTAVNSLSDDQTGRQRNESQKSVTSDPIFGLSEDEAEEVEIENGKRYYRTLRLSSDKLKSLGLVWGANEVRFSITTKYQGTAWCSCNVYLYKWYEKIVISDIDGTITKSDVLGHVIPVIGGQWAHAGVAELYTRIKNNGYRLVYLSSRAIGQSHTTKQYLKSVAQDSRNLPDGPVLLSPTSVLVAFRREVIERRPEEFKIAALTDLKKLFPVRQPFFAGFGNRETDTKSYRAVDIPISRILIIDPTGNVRRADSRGLTSSYLNMASQTVDYLFPPLAKKPSMRVNTSDSPEKLRSSFTQALTHSSFTHWTTQDANIEDDDLLKYEQQRKELEDAAKKKKK